jgi:hypothetical protein
VITTNRDNLDGNGVPTPGDNGVTDANAGMIYNAMTFTGTGDKNLFAVGDRASVTPPANSILVATYTTNVLYRLDISTGAVDGNGTDRINDARAYQGAGTTQREIGQVTAAGTVTGIASVGGQMFAVDNLGFLYRVSTILENSNLSSSKRANTDVGHHENLTDELPFAIPVECRCTGDQLHGMQP